MGYIVLTGASSGIGSAAAIELTRRGCAVLALGRTEAKLEAAHRRMMAVARRGLAVPDPVRADFAAMDEVYRAAAIVLERCDRIDVLVNNAGVQPVRRQLSRDGFELTFAINHLAPFLLTLLLADRIRESGGRVVTTASSNHAAGRIDFSDLQMEQNWRSGAAYDASKLANVLFTIELPARTGLPASCFHPGSITTDLNRDSRWFRLEKLVERFAYGQPRQGADTLVWLATSDEGRAPTAPYYVNRAPGAVAPGGLDRDAAKRLWDISARLVGREGVRAT